MIRNGSPRFPTLTLGNSLSLSLSLTVSLCQLQGRGRKGEATCIRQANPKVQTFKSSLSLFLFLFSSVPIEADKIDRQCRVGCLDVHPYMSPRKDTTLGSPHPWLTLGAFFFLSLLLTGHCSPSWENPSFGQDGNFGKNKNNVIYRTSWERGRNYY